MAKQSQVKARRKIINPVFHLQTKREDDDQLTEGMIKVVRRTGQLNLSGRSLATVPKGMFTMYEIGSEAVKNFDMRKGTDDTWWNFQPLTYLDLSFNVLSEIPSDLSMFEDLIVLNLQDNNLTTVPSELGRLTKLTKLNLSRNRINKLPSDFYNLTELQYLNLSNNMLEKLDEQFSELVMLQLLDLSHNNLVELPLGIGFLVRCTDLNLSHNQLNELPLEIVNMRSLLKLDVTHNNLRGLPRCGELRKLQALHAQHNDIEELPYFQGYEHLQELYLGNNFIKEIPPELCENLQSLKTLDLRDNKIANLPDQIAMLQHLIRLDVTNNELTVLPNSLGLLSNLQNLQIEGNVFRAIRHDLIKAGTCRLLKHLRDRLNAEEMEKLNFGKENGYVAEVRIYPDKYMMKNSRALNVAMKEIATVPDNVFEDAVAADVNIVDLSKNKFTTVPEGLNLLNEQISELNLSVNKLKSLPECIGDFQRLQFLELSRNQLNSLPQCFENLQNLRELVLSFNLFSIMPQCIFKMLNLEILLISDNQLTTIDIDGLLHLKRLAILDLSNNNIDNVPLELGNMKQLRNLELKGNSFRLPRYSILEQGTETILAYLRDRIPR